MILSSRAIYRKILRGRVTIFVFYTIFKRFFFLCGFRSERENASVSENPINRWCISTLGKELRIVLEYYENAARRSAPYHKRCF